MTGYQIHKKFKQCCFGGRMPEFCAYYQTPRHNLGTKDINQT